MRAPALLVTAFAAVVAAVGLPLDTASAAPAGLPSTPLDLELRAAQVSAVFSLLGEVGHQKVVLDDCVRGKVDLKLENAPLPLVFDVLAAKLRLRYDAIDGGIRVGCAVGNEPAPAPAEGRPEGRISLNERDAPARAVLAKVATAAGLAGVDYRATGEPRLTVTLEKVRVSTVLGALADESGLRLRVEGNRLIAEEP